MGLIILIAVGSVAGWLATFVLRRADRQPTGLNMLVGILGALLAGILTYRGSVFEGIGPESLAFSFCGAIVALIPFNLLVKHPNH
ncbi:MAG: GlsB/YeaQ/YmgE family stress response membrane protein [Alteripontixanthobacter sp.]